MPDVLDAREEVYAAANPVRRHLEGGLREFVHAAGKAGAWLGRLLGPFAALATVLAAIYLLAPGLWARTLGFLAFYLTPLGEEAGVPVGIGLGLNPALVVGLILLVDLQFAVFWLANGDALKRVPRVGPWLAKGEEKARRFYHKHRLLEKAGFLGVAVFVLLPMAGTGSSTGAILGKVMGMNPVKAVAAVALGSLGRSITFVAATLGVLQLV